MPLPSVPKGRDAVARALRFGTSLPYALNGNWWRKVTDYRITEQVRFGGVKAMPAYIRVAGRSRSMDESWLPEADLQCATLRHDGYAVLPVVRDRRALVAFAGDVVFVHGDAMHGRDVVGRDAQRLERGQQVLCIEVEVLGCNAATCMHPTEIEPAVRLRAAESGAEELFLHPQQFVDRCVFKEW